PRGAAARGPAPGGRRSGRGRRPRGAGPAPTSAEQGNRAPSRLRYPRRVNGKDLYAVLGVARDASEDEIRKSYRRLARQYHPDVNPNDKTAEERFKEISFAYDVL